MLNPDKKLYVAHSNGPLFILPKMANRHGLIAGATGTGKTVSLQVLAESFSELGIPVFMADMKGDLSGISKAGTLNKFITKRQEEFGVEFNFQGYPTRFFDVFAEQGHPLRTTISDMGPLLLSRLLNLNDTQAGVLNIVFRIADDNKLLLIDLKDLRSMLTFAGDNAREYTLKYGNISAASIGAIQRGLLHLEDQGGNLFFGEPEFNVFDFIQTDNGKGVINILAADKLLNSPKLYATFLLWMLSSLYEELPEVGDLERPKFIFFFDEAHLLFDEAPEVLMDKIEQIVRLIRSKGVGVYFITQNPLDIPETILGQLGNRIQHALRAFTPRDQKAVKTAAQTFRQNPAFDTEKAIMELGTGEALVSFLDEKGAPSVVELARCYVRRDRSDLLQQKNAIQPSVSHPYTVFTKKRWTANLPTNCYSAKVKPADKKKNALKRKSSSNRLRKSVLPKRPVITEPKAARPTGNLLPRRCSGICSHPLDAPSAHNLYEAYWAP